MWIAVLLASAALAQGAGEDYTDSRHHTVHFPLGDKSFADEVVAFNMGHPEPQPANARRLRRRRDRKSTRLNSSHRCISYAVFCLKKKTNTLHVHITTPTRN